MTSFSSASTYKSFPKSFFWKRLILFLVFTLPYFSLFAQNEGIIKGKITDATTAEPLIGATVKAGSKGVVTDIEGNFEIKLPYGVHLLELSYVGYAGKKQEVNLSAKVLRLDFRLRSKSLNEVQVIADIAIDRETPVAFYDVKKARIDEELGSQDVPMVLNSTPGVYATQAGGGDGDARISIRGFNQRYVSVMLDGIPVNDMENGWVYWSNWFGLDVVTQKIQVQRGLGASKLAVPAVGGTINILSRGIESKKSISAKQEFGNDGFWRSTVGFNSGRLKNGFGVTGSFSYKEGNGWVDQTWTQGFFYFLKVQKEIGKHVISATAMGAPQSHGQRSFPAALNLYSNEQAQKLGIEDEGPGYGRRYNPHWGLLRRTRAADGSRMDPEAVEQEAVSERLNYYHKPLFSLKHFWEINDRMYWSNVAYLSIGRGGGVGPSSTITRTDDGQLDIQSIYDNNAFSDFSLGQELPEERKAGVFLRSSINNHQWYGGISNFTYQINDAFTFSSGLDLRSYVGEHYREVYDLLGGDYVVNRANRNAGDDGIRRKGDKIDYHDDAFVRWYSVFSQLEYKVGNFSTFFNASGAINGYRRVDYFRPKEAETNEAGDTLSLDYQQTDWKYIPAYTLKTGANYNLTEHQNVFLNLGLLSRPPFFQNVIDRDNQFFNDIRNEEVRAVEVGYSYSAKKFAANVNLYHTNWLNRPVLSAPVINIDGEFFRTNINGMAALHQGIEIDFIYKFFSNLEVEGIVSLGNWNWTSGDTVRVYDDQQNLVHTQSFDATGVRVGDAAQTQFGGSIRYMPVKNAYFKLRGTYFGDNYADFDPFTLRGENAGRQSWRMPAYFLLDIHAGYSFDFNVGKMNRGIKADWRISVFNAFDEFFISDARNNDPFATPSNNFDAASAGVFVGLGRRFNTSITFRF